MPTNRRRGTPPQRPNAATAPGAPTSPATGSTQRSAGPTQPVTGEVAPEQQAQGALARRRLLLSWMSVGLSGLAGAVVSVPILAYLLSPLLRAAPPEWIDVDDVSKFAIGQTVLRSIVEFSPLPWAGQTAQTAIWVRRSAQSDFTVFAVNCTHLGCPVNWQDQAEIFLCPCHGGVYYADGTVAGGPPPRPLFPYEWRIQGTTLQVRSQGLQVATP